MTTKTKRPRRTLQAKLAAMEANPFMLPRGIEKKGMVYQWDDQRSWARRLSRANGWRPVPARRHPHLPHNKSGQIEFRGFLLMERPAP